MPRKSFKVAVAAEPISFDLAGPGDVPQNFKCRDRMGAGALMRFAERFSSLGDDEDTDGTGENGEPDAAAAARASKEAIPAVREFFNAALVPEARARFWALIDDDDAAIPLETLVEIAGWLSEVYGGGRPTGTNSESGSEVTSSGDGSPATPSDGDIVTYSRPSLLTSSSTS